MKLSITFLALFLFFFYAIRLLFEIILIHKRSILLLIFYRRILSFGKVIILTWIVSPYLLMILALSAYNINWLFLEVIILRSMITLRHDIVGKIILIYNRFLRYLILFKWFLITYRLIYNSWIINHAFLRIYKWLFGTFRLLLKLNTILLIDITL